MILSISYKHVLNNSTYATDLKKKKKKVFPENYCAVFLASETKQKKTKKVSIQIVVL